MSAPTTPSATAETDSLDGWERALLDRQLEALGRLAEMGMTLAAAITQEATAEQSEADADRRHAALNHAALDHAALNHAAMGFARVSRAVRMTFALQSRLIAEFKGGGSRFAKDEAPEDGPIEVIWRDDVVEHDVLQKRQVRGILQRLAEGASLEGEATERLLLEAGERLENDRFYRDLTQRPLGEIVALICKDLGLEPDWDRLAGEYWAEAEIKRPPPGSPYAGWNARRAEQARPPLVPSG